MNHEHVAAAGTLSRPASLAERLNTVWHERSLQIFMAVVLAHWAEHLVQAYQLYAMNMPVPEARGVLGFWFPWLVASETLHYGYALVMVVVLWVLRSGFTGRSYTWWMVAFGIQFWHHIEHGLLQAQVLIGMNLFNAPVPISIFQIWIRRPELHLIYNAAVFIPMIIAMYYHMFPSPAEQSQQQCSCAIHPRTAMA